MPNVPKQAINLSFSEKYSKQHAQAYQKKHHDGLSRKLSNWREIQVARKALKIAGQPGIVLDLPCGAGRFWTMLKEKQNRVIIAADNSAGMLEVAQAANPRIVEQGIHCLQTSVFDIQLPESSVDSIFCMRLLHHIGSPQDRRVMLKELHRVTRDTVIISLWVDGNYKAWRRARIEQKRKARTTVISKNRFLIPRATIEKEFSTAGFNIINHIDFFPLQQMWRTYILRKQ